MNVFDRPFSAATLPVMEQAEPGSGHVARWGFFVVALVLGAALLVSSVTSYLGATTLVDTVIRGQTQALEHALALRLRVDAARRSGRRGPPTSDQLEAFIEEHSADGVTYVAVIGLRDGVLAEAGTRSATELVGPGEHRLHDELVQATFTLPMPRSSDGAAPGMGPRPGLGRPPGEGPPGLGHAPGEGPPGEGRPGLEHRPGEEPPGFGHAPGEGPPRSAPHHGPAGAPGELSGPHSRRRPPIPPRVTLEFVPNAALALRARATRDVGVGVTVAVALLLGATVFWRLSRRAQTTEARLVAQRHLASLGEMSAVLAHEIRNPLASLKGHVQLLAERVEDQPTLERKTARILDETLRLETLTRGLLDFSRSGGAERVEVDPVGLLRRRAEQCPADVHIADEGAPQRWSLDAAKFEQVVDNLLDNARQAAPARPIEASVRQEAGALVVRIRDHGDGVPAAERERIFEPFVTSRTRGTGLGLAVCRRIVELHGGTLEVRDAPGGGACFVATIPSPSVA